MKWLWLALIFSFIVAFTVIGHFWYYPLICLALAVAALSPGGRWHKGDK